MRGARSCRTFESSLKSASWAHNEFERCWHNANATRYELPTIGVNEVLGKRYDTNPRINLTRSMNWNMDLLV